MSQLGPDVVARILGHMNADHAEANLAIVQANHAANAVAAEMVDLTPDEGVWTATYSDDSTREVRVPWGVTIETSEQAREVIVVLSRIATEHVAATHTPEVVARRHLPPAPEGGWEAAMRRFHEELRARGGSFFGH